MLEKNQNNWKEEGGRLTADFGLDNFKKALEFVNKVGALAEETNHHPDILLHDYNRVKIELFSHEENRITKKDRDMAQKISFLAL